MIVMEEGKTILPGAEPEELQGVWQRASGRLPNCFNRKWSKTSAKVAKTAKLSGMEGNQSDSQEQLTN